MNLQTRGLAEAATRISRGARCRSGLISLLALPAAVIFLVLPATSSAAGSNGSLTQKSGLEACISEDGTSGACTQGVGLDGANSVTVSPDGKSAYVSSSSLVTFNDPSGSAVAVFDRDTATGALTQKSGIEACISEDGSGGDCTDGVSLNGAVSVTVSPDGTSAYIASGSANPLLDPFGGSVAVFDRNTTTGVLSQKSGTGACTF